MTNKTLMQALGSQLVHVHVGDKRSEAKPPITLSTGKVVRHYRAANGSIDAECTPLMNDSEWLEYAAIVRRDWR